MIEIFHIHLCLKFDENMPLTATFNLLVAYVILALEFYNDQF